ncbi:YfcC family protein [Mediterraneibacter glycyrrhizinilyticus]|uniref:YfcC family protein n=1 Tax=Mediterraneibacter glycyrrhizinilyticus TaxID=342942 RepID=UPI000B36552B|nr:TIGR00366 family protein [Mediterraneibacter glycyrrhizinilyticus]MCF2570484.1 YfcC family protein [Mediterraneibacter glycyrrhizinilyticus]OUO24493.1 C4-dicarboxylate anaerobic carrier [Lachnoclostridium sp. An298]HJA20432.1 TIGR00366 family protein [Candidatus Mediterraneibacter ornithocaccae]
MNGKTQKQKGFHMPHVFIILLIIMLFVVILSYIIPSGLYERIEDSSGITVIDPDTFQYVENETPITFMDYFEAIYTGFVNGATIMGTLFISSGAIYLLEVSGAFGAGINMILKKTKGKEFSVVCIFYTIFVVFGVLGYGEAAYPFYPLAVTIGFALGYDRMVGTALAIVGSTVGFTSGLMNTFTTGVAQQIVGLPLFSGIGFRAVGLVVFYVIGLIGLYTYCRKIKKNPALSLMSEEYMNQKQEDHTEQMEEMNPRRVLGLLVFLGIIVVQGFGCIRLGWSFPQIAAIYVIMAILLAIIFRFGPSEACQLFCKGAVRVFAAAFAVGLAQSVVVLMNQACIMDTIVHAMSQLLENRSAILALLIIFIFVTLFNFLVVSGSGKAVIVMPILQPLGKILNINQQVLVLTYQYGDGITNSFWPGSSLVQLSMCGVDYGSWIKFCWKIYLGFIVSAFVLVMIAYGIGYGPF